MGDMKSLGDILNSLMASRQMTILEKLVSDSEKMGLRVGETIRAIESGMTMMSRTAKIAGEPKDVKSIEHDLETITKIREVMRKTQARYAEEAAELRAILESERSRFLNEPVER